MTRTIFIYGVLAGSAVILTTIIGTTLSGGHGSLWFGYLVMLAAFSVIFVAIKTYRDQTLGGVISFKRAALMGLAISATAGVAYTIGWEIYLAATDYAYVHDYADAIVEKRRAAGASAEEMAKVIAQTDRVREQYKNPAFRLPVTFSEIFPVGLIVTLVSAGLLRNEKFMPAQQKPS